MHYIWIFYHHIDPVDSQHSALLPPNLLYVISDRIAVALSLYPQTLFLGSLFDSVQTQIT